MKILNRSGVSRPYYSKSGPILLSLSEEYLFNGKENTTLNSIIESSTENEAIVLWNLFQRVKPDQRNAVFDKLYELVLHADDISKKDMISLDKDKLQRWLSEIKWYL